MPSLALANVVHHKLRSALAALGIGIGICMLVTLSGLARGTLYEIADRWMAVDADLILQPRGWSGNASDKSGSALPDKYADIIGARHGDLVECVVPVFLWPVQIAGQFHMAAGVAPEQWQMLTGGRALSQGRLFDPHGAFADWLEAEILSPRDAEAEPLELGGDELSTQGRNGLEIVIDTRLAHAGRLQLNQTIHFANHDWTIVGIVPAGVMTRLFMPRRTAQFLFGNGDITRSTLMFIKLREGTDVGPAARAIEQTTRQDAVPLARYRGMLAERFGLVFVYVDTVNIIALIIAFLFIMVILYTMVIQQTRDIAILKANGASNLFLLRQVLGESLLLTGAGTAAGIGLSFVAAWLIALLFPLMTVTIEWHWIGIALGAALVGALLSGLYPAWRATRVDMVAALSLE